MSEETNKAVIQRIYEAFNKGDIQGVLSNVAPDAEWIDHGPNAVPYFGDFTGRIPDFFKAIGESTTNGSVTPERFVMSGDSVITEGRYRATARGTGAAIDAPIAHFFTLRDGKITSWRGYADTAAVHAAHVGKSTPASKGD